MGISEYLTICTEQMRCRRMRPIVEGELRMHMEEQMEAYLADGMEPSAAEEMAVKQMGDPVEAGNGLDRVHRPKMDWRVTGLILVLSLAGLIFQLTLNGKAADASRLFSTVGSMLTGLALMFAVCFVDYTIVGKYPVVIWCALVGLAAGAGIFSVRVNGITQMGWIVMLLVPAYGGIVYHYRSQRGKGILKAAGWLLLAALVLFYLCDMSMVMRVWLLLGGVFLLGYAVARGWFQVPRIVSLLIFAIPAAGLSFLLTAVYMSGGYRAARIRAFLNPSQYADGMNYIPMQIREAQKRLNWFGPASGNNTFPFSGQESYALLTIAESLGILAALLLALVFAVLAAELIRKNVRQKNRLGSLLAMGCFIVLMLPVGIHILLNTGLFPPTGCSLPFISMRGKEGVCLYLLMGLLLSVYRNSATAPEPSKRAARQKI